MLTTAAGLLIGTLFAAQNGTPVVPADEKSTANG